MPKARRFFQEGHCYHLTHRCHNRRYLLRFAKDREAYCKMLRACSSEYKVPVLGYCLTSNHIHLLVLDSGPGRTSRFMDALQGSFAQRYNARKGRSGAYWSGRYHATAIEQSGHLWNCLIYIDLNMVRAQVVNHPREWPWCSYGELIGTRKRYRVVNRDAFARAFGRHPDVKQCRDTYSSMIDQKIRLGPLIREPAWSESLAVGSLEYIERVSLDITNRRELEKGETTGLGTAGWVLREQRATYKA